MKREEFCAAYQQKQLLGFARLRQHPDCIELCSLGVLEPFRGQGIGKAITTALIKKARASIYVVCIIPDFFNHFGFTHVQDYPLSVHEKLVYCSNAFPIQETYVAMRLD